MLMGASALWRSERLDRHSSSSHWYLGRGATIDAVAGGISAARAMGSARAGNRTPFAATISYLYRAPGPMRGIKSSQMPDPWRSRIGWRRPSQRLKSPITETLLAFGAHTEKDTPSTPS